MVCLNWTGQMGNPTETVRVWLHWDADETHLSRHQVASTLAEEGIACEENGTAPDPGLSLIVFSKESQELVRRVKDFSQNGSRRVLGIAASKRALAGSIPWKLLQAGASDVSAWEETLNPAAVIAARFHRWKEIENLVASPSVREHLAGRSRAWISVLRQVVEVARFTDSSVLLTGETGTGKELIAHLIHALDCRAGKRELIVLDCTTVVPELSGSEFFGHERGAFTHAVTSRDGAFGLADGGSLFLDEVGELPLSLQAELLRIVQERTYKRIGSNVWKEANFRLICATNRNLHQEQARGAFRLDFYHRIASWTCHLPSLDQRREDIIPLAEHFLRQVDSEREPPALDGAVRDYLLLRNYPGNVRDLRQLVTRMAKRHVGPGPITVGDIPEDESPFGAELMQRDWRDAGFRRAIRQALTQGVSLRQISHAAAEVAIQVAMEDEQGNVQRAARKLGVTDRALQLRRAAQREGEEGSGFFKDTLPEQPTCSTDRETQPPPGPLGL
jgi:transcriptional regulator with GAF, ATPase, and Fis domain